MKNKIVAQILSLALLFPAPIFAQEAEEPRFTQLEQGDEAPFAGTLFNPAATAQLITDSQFALEECDLKIQYLVCLDNDNIYPFDN